MRIELDATDLEPLVERVVAQALRTLHGANSAEIDIRSRLALNRKEAAAAMGISVSKLDSLTKAGNIPHVRLSGDHGAPSYPRDMLVEWLREQA